MPTTRTMTVTRREERISFETPWSDAEAISRLRFHITEGRTSRFAEDLLRTADSGRRLSPTQNAWIHRLVTERDEQQATNPAPTPIGPPPVRTVLVTPGATIVCPALVAFAASLQAAVERCTGASRGIKVRLRAPATGSQTVEMPVAITLRRPGENALVWHGRRGTPPVAQIAPNGAVTITRFCTQEVGALLRTLGDHDYAATVGAQGRASGSCCFCGLQLTDERSLAMGYGPICAGHYGLPWGDRPTPPTTPAPAPDRLDARGGAGTDLMMADAVRQHAEQIVQMVMRENPSEGQGTRPSWTAVHYEGETAEQRDARSRAASDRHISNLIQRADRPDPTIPEPETTEGQRAEAERWGRLVGLVHILQNLGWDNNVIDRVRFYDGNRRIPWGLTPTRNFVAEMIGVRDSHLHDHTFTAVRDFVRGNTTPMPSPTVHPQDLEETANLIAAVPYAQRVVALMRRMDELGVPYATRASRAIEFGVPAPRAFVRELFGPMSDPAQHAICVEIQRQPRAAPHDSTDRCIAIARGWRERQICNVLRNLALVSDETIEELDFEDITPFGETATRDGVADWLGIDLDADNVAELMMVQNILQRPFPCEEDFHGYPGTRSFLDPIVGRDANIPVHRRTTYGFTGRPGQIEDEGTCTVCGDPSPSDTRDAAGHRICAGCVDEITPTPIEISNH